MLTIDLLRGERLMGRYRFSADKHQLIKIGKIPSSHIFVEGPAVGRLHAVIEFREEGPWLIDMGSLAGTKVNGTKVDKLQLEDGDGIEIGDELLVVSLDEASARPPRPPRQPEPAPIERLATPIPTVKPQTRRAAGGDTNRKQTDRYPAYAEAVRLAGGLVGSGGGGGGAAATTDPGLPATPVPADELVSTRIEVAAVALGLDKSGGKDVPAPEALVAKIARLPPAKRIQAEEYVDFLFWLDSERYPQALQNDLLKVSDSAAQDLRHMRRSTDILLTNFKKQQRWTRVVAAAAVVTLLLSLGVLLNRVRLFSGVDSAYATSAEALSEGVAGADATRAEALSEGVAGAPHGAPAGRSGPEAGAAAAAASGAAQGRPGPELADPVARGGQAATALPSAALRDEARFHYHELAAVMTAAELAAQLYGASSHAGLIRAANEGLLAPDGTLPAGAVVAVPRHALHTVRPGQTLSVIAGQYYGDQGLYRRIYEANRELLARPGAVEVGMQLKVPILQDGALSR